MLPKTTPGSFKRMEHCKGCKSPLTYYAYTRSGDCCPTCGYSVGRYYWNAVYSATYCATEDGKWEQVNNLTAKNSVQGCMIWVVFILGGIISLSIL